MQRGDIVDVDIPRPQGSAGHEQFGTRPALVVQVNRHIANLATVVVVPMTSKLNALHRDGTLAVDPDTGNGLRVRSALLVNQIVTLDKRRIKGKRGILSSDDLQQAEQLIRAFLGL